MKMFPRKLEAKLEKWRLSSNRKPLIIRGARQVGKTSLVRKFAKDHFDNLWEFNLEKREHLRIFDGVESVPDFIKRAEIFSDKKFVSSNSLLFIDEIQESVEVMNLLRFFAEDRPDIFFIATGSLLEAKLNKEIKVPVGRVDFEYLYPLTFLEFLTATGKNELFEEINKLELGKKYSWHDMANQEFGKYVSIGGMPEAVSVNCNKQDVIETKRVLSRLQTTYIEDVAKYMTSMSDKKYLELVVENGPRFAGSLFKYDNFAGSESRSREMSRAFSVVEKTMLLNQIVAINSTNLPLVLKYKRSKKLIWLDVGIVNYVNNLYSELATGVYKGRLMEQVVGQILIAILENKSSKLCYWAKDRNKGSAEVDFCWQLGEKIVGLEVKSGNNSRSKSLSSMITEGKEKIVPVQVSWNKLEKKKNGIFNLPFYSLEKWRDILNV